MSRQEIIKIFGNRKIHSVWDDEAEIWYFSIVDVVAVGAVDDEVVVGEKGG